MVWVSFLHFVTLIDDKAGSSVMALLEDTGANINAPSETEKGSFAGLQSHKVSAYS